MQPYRQLKNDSQNARVSQRYQTVIPRQIRMFLGLKEGDTVTFEIENGKVVLFKATQLDLAFAQALEGTLTEWASDEDETAYGAL